MADFIGIQENTNQTQSSESNLASAIANLETKVANIATLIDEIIIPTINTVNSRVFNLDKNPTVVRKIYTGSVDNSYGTIIKVTNINKCVPVLGNIDLEYYSTNQTIKIKADSSIVSKSDYAIIEFY